MLWLVFCTVGYGSVWAFDAHLDEAAEHHEHAVYTGHAPDVDKGPPACDHCCHASAHIMALWQDATVAALPAVCAGNTPYLLTASFNTTSPPERPPQD